MFTKENTNTMKKVFLSLISVTTLASLCACQPSQKEVKEESISSDNQEVTQKDKTDDDHNDEKETQKTIETVEKYVSSKDIDQYTKESYQKYKSTLDKLKNNDKSSKESVITIVSDALSQLEKTYEVQLKEAKDNLKKAVEQVEKLNLKDYENDTVKQLQEKLNQAQKSLQENQQTLEEYQLTYQQLLNAVEQLKVKLQDTELLNAQNMLLALINKAIILDKNLYTQMSYHLLEETVTEAQKVVKSSEMNTINNTREKLENAIKNLVTVEEEQYQNVLKELHTILEHAKTFSSSTYTKDSFEKLQKTIKMAEKVYNESQDIQQCQNAIKSLEESVKSLEVDESELNEMKERLSEIINKIKNRDWSGYTQKSVEMLNEKVLEAIAVLNSETNLQVISDMIELLDQIEYQMVVRGDTSELESILAHIKTMNKDEYTNESQGVLNIGVERAQIILNDKNCTQDEVDTVCYELHQIITNLQTKVEAEKENLRSVVHKAENLNLKEYIQNSQMSLKNVLEKAKALLEEKEVTVDEVKEMTSEVIHTVDSMTKLGRTKELEVLIKNVQSLDKELYTQKSYQIVEEKLNNAVKLVSNPNRTQQMVSQTIKNLQDAVNKLEKVDTSLLEKQKLLESIDKAEQINSYDYTKDSFLNLENAIIHAKETIKNNDISSYENAIKVIDDAINNLVKKGDIIRLHQLIQTAEGIDLTQYKENGVSQLQEVLEKAKEIVENGASQSVIDKIADSLNEAIKNLERIPNEQTGTYNKEYAKEVLNLVNEQRKKEGLTTLEWDNNLEKAVDVRSKEIAISFSHTRPDGTKFSTAITDKGDFRMFGENIARLYGTPESVMNGWMNSSGHKANILNERYTHMAVSCYEDSYGNLCWVQIFAG